MVKQIVVIASLGLLALSGCNNCEALEQKICEDLGAEDCELWKKANGPATLTSGNRSGRGCFNARFNPMQYGPYLTGAKAVAESMRKAQAASAR